MLAKNIRTSGEGKITVLHTITMRINPLKSSDNNMYHML
jgi:hypothetical protein